MTRALVLILMAAALAGCASREDRQWRDLQTILEYQERAR